MTDRYKVVINHEEQYTIIPANQPLARGWRETGKLGSDRDCLKYIEEVWTDMTRDMLHANANTYSPTTPAVLPHRHPEWTDFSSEPQATTSRRSKGPAGIRARKNTTLQLEDGMLRLQFTGDDPGIAMDLRGQDLPHGPYRLTFRLLDGSQEGGELFYTTDPKTTLPHGERREFNILADGTWQEIALDLPTDQRIYQLRLDVSPGPGKATIADLKLTDKSGNPIASWPQKARDVR